MQFNLETFVKAGEPFSFTRTAPGAQGVVVAGMQGWGVSVPLAAVAAATCGFEGDVHMPNGATLVVGAQSTTVAIGRLVPRARLAGSAVSVPGAVPNVHAVTAVLEASFGIHRQIACTSAPDNPD